MRLGIAKGISTALAVVMLAAACGEGEEVPPEPPSGGNAVTPDDPPPADEPNEADEPDTPDDPVDDGGLTLLELASADSDLSILDGLVAQLTEEGLLDTLTGDGPLTVFAPTNEAFENLPFEVSELTAEQLGTILSYHVISGAEIMSSMIEDATSQESLEGRALSFDVAGDVILLNGLTTVTQADIDASNGIIHLIDTLLIPPGFPFPGTLIDAASYYSGLTTLVSAVGAADAAGAGLAGELTGDGTFTVFAPTNSGFPENSSSLLEDTDALSAVLRYHVLPAEDPLFSSLTPNDIITASDADLPGQATFPTLGDGPDNGLEDSPRVVISTGDEGIQVNDSNVIFYNLVTSNGAIIVIDHVLAPPGDIVAVASANPELRTWVDLIEQQSLDTLLRSPGETPADPGFTVFAPTNDAFDALDALPEDDMLTQFLLYHVTRGQRDSAIIPQFAGTSTASLDADLNGIDIEVQNGVVVLNTSARFVMTDIPASNGIIHVIDSVLNVDDSVLGGPPRTAP